MDKYVVYFTLFLANIYLYMQIMSGWAIPYRLYIFIGILAVGFYFFCKSKYQVANWIVSVPAGLALVYYFLMKLLDLLK